MNDKGFDMPKTLKQIKDSAKRALRKLRKQPYFKKHRGLLFDACLYHIKDYMTDHGIGNGGISDPMIRSMSFECLKELGEL